MVITSILHVEDYRFKSYISYKLMNEKGIEPMKIKITEFTAQLHLPTMKTHSIYQVRDLNPNMSITKRPLYQLS